MKGSISIVSLIVTLPLLYRCNKDDPIPNIHNPTTTFKKAGIELWIDTGGDTLIGCDKAEHVTYILSLMKVLQV